MRINQTHFILYVSNQSQSKDFYEALLGYEPLYSVPGMTEFWLTGNTKLGLMPNDGIAKIITPALPHPQQANGTPRCELYWYVDDVEQAFKYALQCGATLVSAIAERNWGDLAGYVADDDGHVIAFAQKL